MGLCFVGGVQAQTNTAGAVTGQAASGDTITISNPATGFSRTITVGADGNYRFSALPTGTYTVSRNGGSARTVTVNVGTASSVDFVSAAGTATTLDTVTVVGTGAINPIDVTSVESTTILTAEQINKIPVAQNTTAVALLAPGTVRGDAAFGNLASFGGSSVAENQYFVNGFNVTNAFKNLDFAQVPFEAIAEQQVKTGGYGAEFGRSTGGVINQITKRGTNEFHAGGKVEWSPDSLREEPHNTYRTDGTLISDNSKDIGESALASIWASGALIQDRLFAYGLVQYGRTEQDIFPSTAGGSNTADDTRTPKWLLKLDWNISDNHLLEFTGIGDKSESETDYFNTSFEADGTPIRGSYKGTEFNEGGGESFVLKYTGYLTDTFTLSALAGYGNSSRSNYSVTAGGITNVYTGDIFAPVAGCPRISDSRNEVLAGDMPGRVGCNLATFLGRPDAEDTRKQFRLDAEWVLGDHLLRGGIDTDNFESVAGEAYSGGNLWLFFGDAADNLVEQIVFRNGATVEVDSRAYYLEDSWSVTDNFMLYGGIRLDTFENKNGFGETYVKIDDQWAPRLGFSWDVNGDSTFKVFGNAGRYALPIANTVAIRGASASLFYYQDFTYTSVDPVTNEPSGLTPISGRHFLNNEFGVGKDPRTIASQNLEPMYQDEFILGFQKQLTDNFSLGVRGIYRDLKTAIDDQCDYRSVVAWAEENGFDVDPATGGFQEPDPANPNEVSMYNPGFPFCRLYNPGSDGIFSMDVNGDGTFETVTIPADELGPESKRKYTAVEFFWQGDWERFFLQGSYTYARSIGNAEGGVKSDIGQDDTGVTQDFDYPELMIGSYGYLPNDRRHSFKLFGSWDLTDEWAVGANLLVQSGRPVNCFGFLGGRNTSRYRNSYFSCDPGAPTTTSDGFGDNGTTIVPRGTAGRTPWTQSLDMNVAYHPNWVEGLEFKVDVFNVFNSRKAVAVDEAGEDRFGVPRPLFYQTGTSFQTPRSVRFTVRYEF